MGLLGNPYLGSEGKIDLSGTPTVEKIYAIKATSGDIAIVLGPVVSGKGTDFDGLTVLAGDVLFGPFDAGVTVTGTGGIGYRTAETNT